jgi:hypothetical protein
MKDNTIVERFEGPEARAARDKRFQALREKGTKHLSLLSLSTTQELSSEVDRKKRALGKMVYLLTYPRS